MVRVEVVYGPAGGPVDLTPLRLPDGSTVVDALRASGVLERHGLQAEGLSVGVWFKRAPLETPLRDRDRVEIYRPLIVDPKEARRLRYRKRPPVPRGAARGASAVSARLAADEPSGPVQTVQASGMPGAAEAADLQDVVRPGLSGSPTR